MQWKPDGFRHKKTAPWRGLLAIARIARRFGGVGSPQRGRLRQFPCYQGNLQGNFIGYAATPYAGKRITACGYAGISKCSPHGDKKYQGTNLRFWSVNREFRTTCREGKYTLELRQSFSGLLSKTGSIPDLRKLAGTDGRRPLSCRPHDWRREPQNPQQGHQNCRCAHIILIRMEDS